MEDYRFSVFYMNEKTADVTVSSNQVEYQVYVDLDDPRMQTRVPFCFMNITMDNLYEFLESRCMPRDRTSLKQYIEDLGLDEYNPYEIVRLTHGVMWEDNMWLKFPGEDVSWEDVRVR